MDNEEIEEMKRILEFWKYEKIPMEDIKKSIYNLAEDLMLDEDADLIESGGIYVTRVDNGYEVGIKIPEIFFGNLDDILI